MLGLTIKEVLDSFILCAKSRYVVLFVYTWPAFIAYVLASSASPPMAVLEVVRIIIAVTMVAFSVYFYNDLTDIQDDIKNKEMGNPTPASRPIGNGMITEGRLKKYIVVSGVIGLIFAYSLNLRVLALQSLYLFLGLLYSTEPIRLKKRFLMKQIIIAAGCILSILTGAMTVGVFTPPIMYMIVIHFILIMGLNPIMDVRDIRGDKIVGVKSIPVIWGPELTVRLYFVSLFAVGAATLIGYSQLGFNTVMPILVLLILAGWLYVSLPLLKRWDDPVFLDAIVSKKIFPFYLVLQLVPLIGILNLPF
jgi:chlorophyll synthase